MLSCELDVQVVTCNAERSICPISCLSCSSYLSQIASLHAPGLCHRSCDRGQRPGSARWPADLAKARHHLAELLLPLRQLAATAEVDAQIRCHGVHNQQLERLLRHLCSQGDQQICRIAWSPRSEPVLMTEGAANSCAGQGGPDHIFRSNANHTEFGHCKRKITERTHLLLMRVGSSSHNLQAKVCLKNWYPGQTDCDSSKHGIAGGLRCPGQPQGQAQSAQQWV